MPLTRKGLAVGHQLLTAVGVVHSHLHQHIEQEHTPAAAAALAHLHTAISDTPDDRAVHHPCRCTNGREGQHEQRCS